MISPVPARKPIARKSLPGAQKSTALPGMQEVQCFSPAMVASVSYAPVHQSAREIMPQQDLSDYFALPTHAAQVASPSGYALSPVSSTSSTIYSPIFSPGSVASPSSPITNPATPTFSAYPRLVKPIVIPQVLNHSKEQSAIGIPFQRCYAPVLADSDISCEDFLHFLDELNISMAGHVGLTYTRQAGNAVNWVGKFDPTGITGLIGSGISLTADLAQLAYIKGPLAKKQGLLKKANDTIFRPRGLHVSMMGGIKLKKTLGLPYSHALTAPLMTGWTVPTQQQLHSGQRSQVRTLGRIIYQLQWHVEDLVQCQETSHDHSAEQQDIVRRKAAKSVRHWQVQSEIKHEMWRGEALQQYAQAKAEVNPMKQLVLAKMAALKDKETLHVKRISWLVIRNLYSDPSSSIPLADEEDEIDIDVMGDQLSPAVSPPTRRPVQVMFEGV